MAAYDIMHNIQHVICHEMISIFVFYTCIRLGPNHNRSISNIGDLNQVMRSIVKLFTCDRMMVATK